MMQAFMMHPTNMNKQDNKIKKAGKKAKKSRKDDTHPPLTTSTASSSKFAEY
jgi:hypothetical protein